MPIKKKVHKLKLDFEADFILIGIASHENDYRLSWALNKELEFGLVKCNDLIINHPKHKIEIAYSMYNFENEDDYLNYNLISNKSEKGFLLPDHKNIDFILKVSGEPDFESVNDVVNKLKKVEIVITAFILTDIPEKLQNVFVF